MKLQSEKDFLIWDKCLTLAIDGFNYQSMGIAAVITNEDGDIIGSGRNHLSSDDDDAHSICSSSIAHAEINAIHSIKD